MPAGLRRFASAARRAVPGEVPELRATLRRLAFAVHPDRFAHHHPAAAAENARSLAALQGLLSTVTKSRDGHPPASVQRLRFSVHGGPGGALRPVEVLLRTTGGDCRNVVERTLGQLFLQLGLPQRFRWGDGDWSIAAADQPAAADAEVKAAEREAAAAAAAQPAPPFEQPAAAAPEEQPAVSAESQAAASAGPAAGRLPAMSGDDLAEALARLDPLLSAVAAVPWLPPTPAGVEQRHFVLHTVLHSLREDGWALEAGARRVWAGARDAEALARDEAARGTDAASVMALRAVVRWAQRHETELGAPPGSAPGGAGP